ncbi:LOW QUALITY PROTEIN: hypothetical protein HID58_065862 [Brassica napus]|uniref:Uncharacterized protein n=1 Tax=Brassica napus TaxID=3708 RepID=A0ABQ7ZEE3_BRANA|nr:LOW QUALITY PROTEIN: hypothetical protein HID58_065862 [Brassica napus]
MDRGGGRVECGIECGVASERADRPFTGGGRRRSGALLGMSVVWSRIGDIWRAHSQSNGVSCLDMETALQLRIFIARASKL